MLHQWEARERERYVYPCPITADTQGLLRQEGFLMFYEEVTSIKAHSMFLRHFIHKWNAHQHVFQVGPDQWYTPTEEDYFITGLSKSGVGFPLFPEGLASCVAGSRLVYSQRYIGVDVLYPSEFQVPRGQLRIGAFGRQDVQFLSLLISTISHNSNDRKHISCSLLYYSHYLVQKT